MFNTVAYSDDILVENQYLLLNVYPFLITVLGRI